MEQSPAKTENKIIIEWINKGSSVLDLGCGDGELLALLIKEKQVRAQGIELSETAIRRCVVQGLSVFQEDIDTGLSEYADKSFDYVILNQTFQQVKKPDFVLKEALRVGRNRALPLVIERYVASYRLGFRVLRVTCSAFKRRKNFEQSGNQRKSKQK